MCTHVNSQHSNQISKRVMYPCTDYVLTGKAAYPDTVTVRVKI